MEMSTDDAVKVWLNGELIHSNDHVQQGGLRFNLDKVDIKLKQGENHLLMKVANRGGAWAAWAKIVKRDGTTLYGNLGFRLE